MDDLTGERHEGTEADLAQMMRLYDAVPEIDFAMGDDHARRRRLACRQPRDARIPSRLAQALAGRGAASRTRRVMIELLEADRGCLAQELPSGRRRTAPSRALQHDAEMTEAHI